MTRYVEITTNTIVSIHAIRRAHPNSSIPDGIDLSDLGYAILTETPRPEVYPWHRVVEGAPVNNVQAWVQEPMTSDEIIGICTNAVQARLDDFAASRGYDGILSACTYATSVVPKFQSEGQYCVNARDTTWATCYTLLAEVQAGQRAMPTLDDLMILLPTLAWPV